jgi:hypothetical protein
VLASVELPLPIQRHVLAIAKDSELLAAASYLLRNDLSLLVTIGGDVTRSAAILTPSVAPRLTGILRYGAVRNPTDFNGYRCPTALFSDAVFVSDGASSCLVFVVVAAKAEC